MKNKISQKGSSMVEMLGVLAVVTVLALSIIQLIGNIFNMFRENIVANQITDLQKAITERYKFEGNYKSLFDRDNWEDTVSVFLCETKIAPFDMCSGGKLYHRMGGLVFVVPYGSEDYDKYAITFNDLPKAACVRAAEVNWMTQKRVDVYKMFINRGTTYALEVDTPANPDAGSTVFPVSTSEVRNACKADLNTIEWVFY